MDQKAVEKAESRIRVAEDALTKLQSAKNIRDFVDAWYVFLVAAKNVYTVLEQGAKNNAQSRQWFGAKKNERRDDELLQYLFQARDDDEHGLERAIKHTPEVTQFRATGAVVVNAGPNFRNNLFIQSDFDFEGPPPKDLTIQKLDDKPVLFRRQPEQIQLQEVTGRGNIKYAPPTTHLGTPIKDGSPIAVARSGLDYLVGLVNDASKLA